VTWLIHNEAASALLIEDAWVPHGRFRGEGHVPVNLLLGPGESTTLDLTVSAAEAPGTIVENAFLILRVSSPAGGEPGCRLFARMRVEFPGDGAARPVVETVTTQSLQSG
jgi:hypothetical protein